MAFASRCLSFFPVVLGIVAAVRETFVAPNVIIGSEWEVLGPFQSGTREQQWGADPLEAYGGFRNLGFDPLREFPSTLNGSVRFSRARTQASSASSNRNSFTSVVPVVLEDVDWHAMRDTFGWSALQFQAWIRGVITLREAGRYGVWIGGAVEFSLDGVNYDVGNIFEADVLQFSRGGLFLDLLAGEHVLEVRVVNDIRAFGGQIPPKVDVHLALREVGEELVVEEHNGHGGWEVPQIINMSKKNGSDESVCIAGEWGSFALRNEGRDWIVITSLRLNKVLKCRDITDCSDLHN
jgi:hypothetical protein